MGAKSSKSTSGSEINFDSSLNGTGIEQAQAEASNRNKEAFAMLAEPQGVSVAFLNQFATEYAEDDGFSTMTTRQVVDRYMLPKTKGKGGCAYTALLASQANSDSVPPTALATIFVSHCWDAVFEDTVRMVLTYAQEQAAKGVPEEQLYFWIDLFANNQHANYQLDKDWYGGAA